MGISESKAKLVGKLPSMPGNYADAMSTFFGQSVANSAPVRSYKAKITPAVADVWEKKLKRAFGL